VMGDLQRKHDPHAVFLIAALQAAEKEAVCFWRRYGRGVDEAWIEEKLRESKEAVASMKKLQMAKDLKTGKAFKEGCESCDKPKPVGAALQIECSRLLPTITADTKGADESTFWPLITDQFNFCALFEEDVEDVLGLGPVGGQ
jgi:hypothetical protein